MISSITDLTTWQKRGLFFLSFLIVAFGQPVWSPALGLVAGAIGFTLFWRALVTVSNAKERFCIAMGWYAAVQVVQLSWFVSHPYAYIYGVLFFCAWLMGAQWGIIALWIKPSLIQSIPAICALSGLWSLMEMSRLFILSGLPFNPVGLSLSGSLYPLQLASVGGLYGLSFLVILTNLLLLRAWMDFPKKSKVALGISVLLFPYLFGFIHLSIHQEAALKNAKTLKVVLVQSGLPIEENLTFRSADEMREFVIEEWRQVLTPLKKQLGRSIDLIVLPEYLVPYGTHHYVFPFKDIQKLFNDLFQYPLSFVIDHPYMDLIQKDSRLQALVSNAYIVQTLSNIFNAPIVIGLEDSVYVDDAHQKAESYSAAFHFVPNSLALPLRYEKRVLVPMGEYIPFDWCRDLAAQYGIRGSFTGGKSAKIFAGPVPFGTSICYEEIYGHLMRDNRVQGAELLVNLTNDGWYPHSTLPKQHFDHARLRTVENGIPLVRACNTGITGAIDSLGQIVGILDDKQNQEMSDSIYLEVPAYHYQTLYSQFGDYLILMITLFSLLLGLNKLVKNR